MTKKPGKRDKKPGGVDTKNRNADTKPGGVDTKPGFASLENVTGKRYSLVLSLPLQTFLAYPPEKVKGCAPIINFPGSFST